MDLKEQIDRLIRQIPGATWGVADLGRVLREEPEAVASPALVCRFGVAVVVAAPLPKGAFADLKDAPTPLYMHHYRQLNHMLDRLALRVAHTIEQFGHTACCIAASQYVSLSPRPVGHLSHRVLGYYAGLGFIGRPTLLITPRFGPRVRLVSVLTDAPLQPTGPAKLGGCGDCRACIEVCPAHAIREDSRDFDWKACFEQLRRFRKIPFVGQDICGICVAVCPRSGVRQVPAAQTPQAQDTGQRPS